MHVGSHAHGDGSMFITYQRPRAEHQEIIIKIHLVIIYEIIHPSMFVHVKGVELKHIHVALNIHTCLYHINMPM